MLLAGAAPLYNNSRIIPAKTRIVPKAAQHKAEINRQRYNPATTKATTMAAIITQENNGIAEQACLNPSLKSALYRVVKTAKPQVPAKAAAIIVINIFSKIIVIIAPTTAEIIAGPIFPPAMRSPQAPPAIAPTIATRGFLRPRPPSQTNSPIMAQANPRPTKIAGLKFAAVCSRLWAISSIYLLSAYLHIFR